MIKKLLQAVTQWIANRVTQRNQAAMYDALARLTRFKFIWASDLQRDEVIDEAFVRTKCRSLALGISSFIISRDFWMCPIQARYIHKELTDRLTETLVYSHYDVFAGAVGYTFTLAEHESYDGLITISKRSELFHIGKSQSRAVLKAVRIKYFKRTWETHHFKLIDPVNEEQYMMALYAEGVS